MGYRKGLLSTALALVLAACGPSGTQSPEAVGGTAAETHTPEILGVVQVKFEHIGQPDATVNVTVLPSGVESQTLARVGAVTFTQGARGSFATLDGARYLYGTLTVNNAGAARSNIALLGVSTNLGGGGHTLGDTSLAAATRLSGTSLTPTEARGVLPINRRALDLNGDVQVVGVTFRRVAMTTGAVPYRLWAAVQARVVSFSKASVLTRFSLSATIRPIQVKEFRGFWVCSGGDRNASVTVPAAVPAGIRRVLVLLRAMKPNGKAYPLYGEAAM